MNSNIFLFATISIFSVVTHTIAQTGNTAVISGPFQRILTTKYTLVN